jgi:hypothetical protein
MNEAINQDGQQVSNGDLGAQQPYIGGTTPFDTYNSSIVLLTGQDSFLRDIELKLRNCDEDDNNNAIPRTNPPSPLLNDLGVSRMMSIISTFTSRNVVLGKYETKQINNIMLEFREVVIMDLLLNGYKYRIKDNATKSEIAWIVIMTPFTCMQRGLDQGERIFLSKTTNENILRHDSPPQRRKGIFNMFKGG